MRTCMAIVLLIASAAASAADQSDSAPRLLKAQDLLIHVEPAALQRQYDALQAMRLDSIEYSRLGPVKRISGDTGIVLPTRATDLKAGDSGDDVLQLFRDVLLSNGTESLKVIRHDGVGFDPNPSIRALRLSQEIRGIPVINSFIGINYDDATRRVSKFVANFIPDRGLPREAKYSAAQAEQFVTETGAAVGIMEGTHLAYYEAAAVAAPPKLVWIVRMRFVDDMYMQWSFFVNAVTGLVVGRQPESQN
jgi:hypothetical protein